MIYLCFIFLNFSSRSNNNRQSGFLTPSIIESSVNASSVQIPYYKVLSENKDLTISPRLYTNNDFMIQNEYRQVEKNQIL